MYSRLLTGSARDYFGTKENGQCVVSIQQVYLRSVPSLPTIKRVATLLAEHHPHVALPVSADPFELVLWEQVAYLATDDVRSLAFTALKERVGLSPERVQAAPLSILKAIARIGGSIAVSERAERMERSAKMATSLAGLNSLTLEEARKRLAKFPMIGAPGADRILLFTGRSGTFALDSNGLRVLLRIGFGKEGKSYAVSYRAVMDAIFPGLPERSGERISLYQRLRQHGLLLCKRSRPQCEQCSLRPHCRHGRSDAQAA